PRVFSRPAPAHKAYANLPDRLRCAQTNYFAHLQPRMRNRWVSRETLDDGRFRIIYRGDFRDDSFADVIADWLKKHGERRRDA
ncbi:MAG: hypothetical protein ABSH52_24775, partial [Terriglobia bacterium]